jgi:hypothetical protein
VLRLRRVPSGEDQPGKAVLGRSGGLRPEGPRGERRGRRAGGRAAGIPSCKKVSEPVRWRSQKARGGPTAIAFAEWSSGLLTGAPAPGLLRLPYVSFLLTATGDGPTLLSTATRTCERRGRSPARFSAFRLFRGLAFRPRKRRSPAAVIHPAEDGRAVRPGAPGRALERVGEQRREPRGLRAREAARARAVVVPRRRIDAAIRRRGLIPRSTTRTLVWQVMVYARP